MSLVQVGTTVFGYQLILEPLLADHHNVHRDGDVRPAVCRTGLLFESYDDPFQWACDRRRTKRDVLLG